MCGAGIDRTACARAVGSALRLLPHERIIMNFARYRAGDYLDSHTDRPSGNAAYERQRAFVSHAHAHRLMHAHCLGIFDL